MQKSFYTVNHKILLRKFEYYSVSCECIDWFKSYVWDYEQFISVIGYNFYLMVLNCDGAQGFFLGSLLFLIYIIDFHKEIQHYNVHQFVDDTNLFYTSKSNNRIDHNMNWLNANKFHFILKND